MAGYLQQDPAVEKWVRMRESTAKHFRWNARNVRTIGILGLVIPAGILYLATEYNVRLQRPEQRNDLPWSSPSAPFLSIAWERMKEKNSRIRDKGQQEPTHFGDRSTFRKSIHIMQRQITDREDSASSTWRRGDF